MNKLKKIIAKNFKSFAFYFSYLRYRILLAVVLSIAVGVLDSFGLTMFLPLLEMVSGAKSASGESLGRLEFVVDIFQDLGISMELTTVLVIMVVFFLLKGIAKFTNDAYRATLRQLFIGKIRKHILSKFNRVKFKFFVMADVGRIQNTMSGEVERVSRSFQDYFRTAEKAVLVVVYMVFAFFVDAQFAILVSVGGFLTNFLYKVIYKRTKGKSKEFTADSHIYQGQIIQHVANFKYLRATALTGKFASRLRKSIDRIEDSRKKIGIYNAILVAAREPIMIIVIAVVMVLQVKFFGTGLGAILLSLLFFYRALTALLAMQNSWNRFLEVSGSVDNVIRFQNEIRKNQGQHGRNVNLESFSNALTLQNAYFSYEDNPILKDINLTIAKNESVAFVGESGSGKTTLTNIIAGLMPLDRGEMLVDDQNIADLNVDSYQKKIGYITQEPVIFNDTIYNNVTFWDEDSAKNQKRFQHALAQASILEFIQGLSKGRDTVLGNNGINLSGGQKQRISIARELYKEIDVLIMDEATSALDTETENSIQQSIDKLKGSYTMLIVAHRLSTIKNADRIVLMKDGRIDQIGGYKDLIAKNTNFKRMVELQEL